MLESCQPDSKPIKAENFRFVCELVYREAAIVLGEGKEYLVESRLLEVASRNRFPSINAFIDQLRYSDTSSPMVRETIDALTTNETLFFRDFHPFEALRRDILPGLFAESRDRRLVIWSAACSSGQEPYSLAMLLAEHFPSEMHRVQIMATDISTHVLRRARAGVYTQLEVNRGLPAAYLVKYFRQTTHGWQVREDLRRCIDFQELNLSKPWPYLPRFDLVLLRNVMIYFDIATRRRILAQVREVLLPGSYLILGGAETTMMIDDSFVPLSLGRSTLYRR